MAVAAFVLIRLPPVVESAFGFNLPSAAGARQRSRRSASLFFEHGELYYLCSRAQTQV